LLNDFMSRGERIFVGTVKRLDKGDMIIESGRVEGRLKRTEMIRRRTCAAATACARFCWASTRPCAGRRSC
jgi:hypothetical protein